MQFNRKKELDLFITLVTGMSSEFHTGEFCAGETVPHQVKRSLSYTNSWFTKKFTKILLSHQSEKMLMHSKRE